MKILIIGGNGFFGSKITNLWKSASTDTVVVGGKSGKATENYIKIDLENKNDYGLFSGFNLVINCYNLTPNKYKDLIDHCLTNEINFIETTADFNIIKECFKIKKEISTKTGALKKSGLFLFGVGVFPGMSNLVIKNHIQPLVSG